MADYTHLLWLDLETTGTDQNLDSIIEIATILTTTDLRIIDQDSRVVKPTRQAMERLQAEDFVRNMHETNGLLGALQAGEGEDINDVDQQVVNWLRSYMVEPHKVVIAGSGVAHFDRRFIAAQMPLLNRYLAYPVLDIGIMRRGWEMWGGPMDGYPDQANKTHRAMDDIQHHLNEARWFQDRISLWSEGKAC